MTGIVAQFKDRPELRQFVTTIWRRWGAPAMFALIVVLNVATGKTSWTTYVSAGLAVLLAIRARKAKP